MEKRAFSVESKGRTLSGYAAVFDSPTLIGSFSEVVKKGAFTRSLSSQEAPKITAIYEHNPEHLLGRLGSNTLRLWEDDKGLRFELDLPSTTLGNDVAELVKRGDLAGCSFGFIVRSENWTDTTREILDVDLFEITITSQPAYDATSVDIRAKNSARLNRLSVAQKYLECFK
jgi:HK97 family phage prohead protease